MELTLDQALQSGIEAHKAGNVQDADRYYTAILKVQPKHPDANHNMGILAVGVGKVEKALPFFKTALEINRSISQFWLSYIDALIKLDRIDDAKAVFDQAKSNGAQGDGFDQIKLPLNTSLVDGKNEIQEDIQTPYNILDEFKLDKALKLANKKAKDGLSEDAKKIYQSILKKFPKNKNALDGIKTLASRTLANSADLQEPPKDQLQSLVNLYTHGQHQQALNHASQLQQQFPYSINLYNITGAINKQLGKLDEAIAAYTKALSINPNYVEAYYNMGVTLRQQGKLDEAIEAYAKALSINPNYAGACYNMGNALKDQGRLDGAIEAYAKVLAIKPDYADAYNNMGNALRDQGKLEKALDAYNKALSIKPNYAEAYNNMGNARKDQGKLDEAVDAYTKALAIKPDNAEAYYNMGLTLQRQGKLDEAIAAYNKSLSLKPDYDNAYWNLYGTAENISEAKQWIEKCLVVEPNHLKAKLTLSALKFYEGDKSEFNEVMNSLLKGHPFTRSFAWAFSLPQLPPLHFHRWALFDHMTELSKKDRPFYEFGVWRAEAFRYLIKTFKKGYGFDTFEGIPEDWHHEKAGTYTSDGNIPKIKGGKFIVGKFEDTLPDFFAQERPMASIINFDADLYSSTICALNFAKPVIDQHTILIFDEFIINDNWEQDEYKALEEFCSNNDYTYEVLAISFFTKQVAVKIIGI